MAGLNDTRKIKKAGATMSKALQDEDESLFDIAPINTKGKKKTIVSNALKDAAEKKQEKKKEEVSQPIPASKEVDTEITKAETKADSPKREKPEKQDKKKLSQLTVSLPKKEEEQIKSDLSKIAYMKRKTVSALVTEILQKEIDNNQQLIKTYDEIFKDVK